MTALATLARAQTATAALSQVPDQLKDIYAFRDELLPELHADPRGRGERLAAIAARHGISSSNARKLFDRFKAQGVAGLIDKRKDPKQWKLKKPKRGLSPQDIELLKTWCEKFQRKNEPAIRALLEAWKTQRVPGYLAERGLTVPHTLTPINPATGWPWGWTERNLIRKAPKPVEAKAARIGLSAARSEMPLVYTTRRELYVGQFYLWDDKWHDEKVVDLDQKKIGRPLEFHGCDLKSTFKFAWGSRTRIETEVKNEGLKASDFRFVLAAGLVNFGYHATLGTTNIVENGTATVPEHIERMLHDATGGMIKFRRAPMEGAAAHAAQYAGRAKGNFRIKASLESLGGLEHNELACLPAQVGMDRDHCPEEMHRGGKFIDPATGQPLRSYGRDKYADALLAALSQLPPERAQWLEWDRMTIQQHRLICEEIYGRLSRRTKHELEGWDEYYVPDRLGGMRRLSPYEVAQPQRRYLTPISMETVALLIGPGEDEPVTVRKNMICLHDGGISGDELRFDAVGLLPDREKFRVVLNPFDPARLFCYDARGRFVAVLPRIFSVNPAELEQIHRAAGEKKKREAQLLQPLRLRHAAEARITAARHEHNANVINGGPEIRTRGPIADADAFSGELPEPAGIDGDSSAVDAASSRVPQDAAFTTAPSYDPSSSYTADEIAPADAFS